MAHCAWQLIIVASIASQIRIIIHYPSSQINLHGAYNLVHIAEGDEWKTAFRTCYSSYKFQVMHYGLTNAPASFQCFMNDTFKDMLDIFVVVYLDNILIYSNNPAKHSNHVREVL